MKTFLSCLFFLLIPAFHARAQSYYGAPWGADDLSNITIGQYLGRKASYRIKAAHTGTTDGIRFYFIDVIPGYATGDGGDILIEIQTDDGTEDHLPSGTALASYTVYDPMDETFPYIPLSADLVEGDLYHIVFSNVDPDPVSNYISIDDIYIWNPTSPMQPMISDEDLAVLLKRAANWDWELYNHHTPIYSLEYTDGYAQGMGYMDGKTSYTKTIDDTNRVRQSFTVSGGDRAIADANVRVKKVNGGGDLSVRLEEGGGSLIEEGTIPEADIDTVMCWVGYQFSHAYLLEDGQDYHVVLYSGGGEYSMNPIQQGTYYGFHEDTVFDDGRMWYDDGGGWQAFSFDGDMQFYFTLSEGDSDLDGLDDSEEAEYGTSFADADSDDDGYSDLVEISGGSDPLVPGWTAAELSFTISFQPSGSTRPEDCAVDTAWPYDADRGYGWQ